MIQLRLTDSAHAPNVTSKLTRLPCLVLSPALTRSARCWKHQNSTLLKSFFRDDPDTPERSLSAITMDDTRKKAIADAYAELDLKRIRPWANETEVRQDWVSALQAATDLTFDLERGRRDSSYNNVVIEFKGPGLFNGKTTSPRFKEAIDERLLPYIMRKAKETGLPEADFIGIAVDGDHICFAQVHDGAITYGNLLPFSLQSFNMVATACLDDTRPAVISENLIRDFGHQSAVATDLMQVFSDALSKAVDDKAKGSGKIRMLFEEWRSLYGQVADLSVAQRAVISNTVRFTWSGAQELLMPARLFVIHTYNSLLIKLLAAEIVAAHGLTAVQRPAEAMSALLLPQDVLDFLDNDIERGRLFDASNIKGFVEEAIFSWYLEAGKDAQLKDPLVRAVQALAGRLALYRTDRLQRQRDTLRDFYQDLVPESLRRSLGEFYTPDWLVDFTVDQVKDGDWLGKRHLDPTCGSGSFLIALLRRKMDEAVAKGMTPAATLAALVEEVWGFDLNPLAVQTSRVNFLMEVADLLALVPGTTIEIPVLLADAIYSPAQDPALGSTKVVYKIGSSTAGLTITLPAPLAFDRQRLDSVLEIMGTSVESDLDWDHAKDQLAKGGSMSKAEATEWNKPLKDTYNQVLELHRKNWNGIWFRIVRNFFWSATAGEFDAIVGNPPWVRWSSLPEAYRNRVKDVCRGYDIFARTGRHGGNELDISAMITYTTADKWLKVGGKLAFVITQAVFQNPSSAGFRNFRIDPTGKSNLIPIKVDDLKALKPFPNAANKTSVASFSKGPTAGTYPVPYFVWSAAKNERRSIDPSLTWSQVSKKTQRTAMEATPVMGEGSPWAIMTPGRFAVLSAMSQVDNNPWVEGRKGITADLNGVYFVRLLNENQAAGRVQIQSRPEAGKTDIGAARTAWIEPDWLYPLVKGAADFRPCYLNPAEKLYTLVPNRGIRKADFEQAENEATTLNATLTYLRHFNRPPARLLENRSTYRTRMKSTGAPFYAIYNVGEFTFKPWKVVWAEMAGKFSAAVAGSAQVPGAGLRPYVPDHKIFFVAFDDKDEAHYLCGILNSPTVAEFVESHNVAIQVGDIFKHMRLPRFNTKEAKHLNLARMVEQAHAEHNSAKREAIVSQVRKSADAILSAWLASL